MVPSAVRTLNCIRAADRRKGRRRRLSRQPRTPLIQPNFLWGGIVDDHAVNREGLRNLFGLRKGTRLLLIRLGVAVVRNPTVVGQCLF